MSEQVKLQEIIARVQQMERYFNEVSNAVHTDLSAINEDATIRKMIWELTDYIESGQWLQDYECDERGELPVDLKRGVLSEDLLYNLLCKIKKMSIPADVEMRNISLTGRLCYLFMCIERYLISCYPDKDWSLLAQKCWQWTNIFWNEGCDKYSQIVPEYLFAFDNYEETNEHIFDGELSECDYFALKKLYTGITNGDVNDEINQLLMLPVHFNNECECTDFWKADEQTLGIISKVQDMLLKHNIEYPKLEEISTLTIDKKNGWGDFFDSEHLSIIIK